MPIQFTGGPISWVASCHSRRASSDGAAATQHLKMAERAGLGRIAIEAPACLPDNHGFAGYALASTSGLGVLMTHRTGLIEPTVAAQQLAMLDRLGEGQLAIKIVPGNQPDRSTKRERLDHEKSLARADEYLLLLKRLWLNDKPFDHEGQFYSVRRGFTETKPFRPSLIPLHIGGRSGLAIKLAARHAEIFTLPPGSLAETCSMIARVRDTAAIFGRGAKIGFSLPVAAVIGRTREEAWRKASRVGTAEAVRLVGEAEEVVAALIDYHELDIAEFVVHGLDTAEDFAAFASRLAPLAHRPVSRRETASADLEDGGRASAAIPRGFPGMFAW